MITRARALPAWGLVALLAQVLYHAPAWSAPTTAPMVYACTNPVPPRWPGTHCLASSFQPLTNLVPTVATGSAAKPVWAHTYGFYTATSPELILTCPAGAEVSADFKTCSDGSGKDAAKMVAKKDIQTFSIDPASSANPVPGPIVINWTAPTEGTKGETITGTLNYLLLHRLQPATTADAPVHVGAPMTAIYTVTVAGVHCWSVEAFLVTSPATISDSSGEKCQAFDPVPPPTLVPSPPGTPTLTLPPAPTS